MNSINKNRPEDNHEDLIGTAAVEKIKTLTNKATVCFFCTKIETGESFSSRPMTVQKVDEEGNIFFLSASDSRHNGELTEDPYVQLLSQGSDYSDFLNIYGIATISTNKAMIKELWKPVFKTWFPAGEDDPRITVIKIKPLEGYYWDTKHSFAVRFVKQVIGAAIGKTIDDSIEGRIKV